jgi:predicted ester cyclase
MRSDFVFNISTVPGGVRGIPAYKEFVRGLRLAFPDGAFLIDTAIGDETRAAARWHFQGTHRGEFLGVAPTGKKITDNGIDIFRIANGKITDIWANEDAYGLFKQLGAVA